MYLNNWRDIYSICTLRINVAAYKWKAYDGKIKIVSFMLKFRSSPVLTVNLYA